MEGNFDQVIMLIWAYTLKRNFHKCLITFIVDVGKQMGFFVQRYHYLQEGIK